MRNGRPASRPITNPLATTPTSLVTRRKCSSPGPSQGDHITSRSMLDLRTLGSAICAYSVGGVGENHRTSCGCYLRAAVLEIRAAEEPLRSGLDVKGIKAQVLRRIEKLEEREDL